MRCNAEFYYIGKIPRTGRPSLQRGVVFKWFYSPRAVGTTSSEVHALHQVPFQSTTVPANNRIPQAVRQGIPDGV